MIPALSERRRRLDDWMFDAAFPMWWRLGADHEAGGFQEAIDLTGQVVLKPRRARVQARQVFSYAAAGRFGWRGPWREAVAHGLDFFVKNYRRPDGLFRTLVARDGSPLDEATWLYDQAFALLALAEADSALDRPDLRSVARRLAEALEVLRLPGGGYIEASPDQPYQSNPHMHLFEACLAWEPRDPLGPWTAMADDIAGRALSRYIDANGALHEYFAADWSPAEGVAGRIVEPGHQFEWAWLLERWSRLRRRPDAHTAARRLYEIGAAHGVDPVRGVAFDQLLDDFSAYQPMARLWPQTERLKAALILAEGAGSAGSAYLDDAANAVDGLFKYLDVDIGGLWRDKMNPDGSFVDEPAPASSFYHIVCAAEELRRLVPTPGDQPS